jgi:hypothetical protein
MRNPWKTATFGAGPEGLEIGEDKLLHVLSVRDGKPKERIWLYARRLDDGNARYAISNASSDTPPEKFRDLSRSR